MSVVLPQVSPVAGEEASDNRYRRLFEAARDGILILDAETGMVVDVNPFLIELLGYSREAFLGKKVWELGFFKDIVANQANFGELQRKEYLHYEDMALETSAGRRIEVEFVSYLYLVDQEKVIQCNIRDITARKREEENLRRLATVVRDSNDAITIQDFEGRITAWNHGAELMYGHSEAEALLMNIERLTAPEKVAEQQDFIRRLVAGEDVTSFETRRVTKDGRVLDVWMTVTKLMNDAGKPIGLASTERDITTRKREEKNLRRMATVVRDSNDAITIQDFEGRITAWNHGAELMYGHSEAEALLMNIERLTAPEKVAEQQDFVRRLVAGEDVTSFETQRVTKDGRVLDVWMTVTKLMDDAGKPTGLASTERDITARRREEAERQKLEEQLRAAQKMEAIGSLAGGVAHDFNNLLSVILSYTGFAMEGVPDGDPLKNDLLEVEKAGQRAAALTRQLLAFSRKQVLQPVALSLNQSATSVEKMLQRILGEDIDLVQVLAPDLGLTLADPSQIEQVLMNLVVNARDAMPEGGKLTIETSNVEIDADYAARYVAVKPGSYVQLAVSDTGCGMDEGTRARIFEPFFTTKEKGKGTGLGLSTVYGIVKQSGGNLWVYSEVGQGTTFKVFLPRDLSATTATAIKPATVTKRATGTETILVVEDEQALLKVALRTLASAGYKVLTARDGVDGLLQSAQHPGDIHLLLTDVIMPQMNGRVLAQNLVRARPAIKVLYMSGYTDNAMVHHDVLDAGTQFLAKPFTASDLARKVREVLDGGIEGQ